ncbi:hypothetical protein Pcinc_037106 [Petrolisthes cinctipes]|uniref:Uncharacterized protein n=1 Tax=Petrolisthes cinctipes TaxID=88211 RepID=A0AAE1BUQ8_PETCI|nr:hypothetical protein Pcinc_037106 [Petrolisthes cinctipes]
MPLNYTCNPVSSQCYARTSSFQYTLHLSVELWSNWSCRRDLTTFIVCYSSFRQQQQQQQQQHITIGYCV